MYVGAAVITIIINQIFNVAEISQLGYCQQW